MQCCSCNGCNAVCKQCVCSHAKKPFFTYLPKNNKCANTLPLCVNSLTDLSCHCVLSIVSNGLVNQTRYGLTDNYVSLAAEVNNSWHSSGVMSDKMMDMSNSTEDHTSLTEPSMIFMLILLLASMMVLLTMMTVYPLKILKTYVLQ